MPPQVTVAATAQSVDTLADVLLYAPELLSTAEDNAAGVAAVDARSLDARLLLFQLLSALAELYGRGEALGTLQPEDVLLHNRQFLSLADRAADQRQTDAGVSDDGSLAELTERWRTRQMTNLDYLLRLNTLAGRRAGDHAFAPMLPWVLDFSMPPEPDMDTLTEIAPGWRDLSKTKWRLAKGDEQLQVTYASSGPPHHISDEALSELAVCIYQARRLPKELLQAVVRGRFEALEYPVSLERLYRLSPDEAIAEFYTDPEVFQSVHPDMPDLQLPAWASSAADFLRRHRAALESDRVSHSLHRWIDLNFGHALRGDAAVANLNVELPRVGPGPLRRRRRPQLFDRPHPRRLPRRADSSAPPWLHLSTHGSALELMSRLEELEVCASGCSVMTDAEHGGGGTSGIVDAQTADVRAVGCIAVQLFRCRRLLQPRSNKTAWDAEVQHLPLHLQSFVLQCLHAEAGRTAASLRRSEVFTSAVRQSYQLLQALQVQPTDGVHRLQQLAGWVSEGGLAKADAGLLQLVVPICLQQLRSTLQQQWPPDEDSRAVQLHFHQVFSAVVTCLSRREAERCLPPLLADVFSADSAAAAACQMACTQPDTVALLAARLGPQAFLLHVHPLLLQFLCTGRAPALCQAAIGAVEATGVLFPLPITLHHVVPSLIACLGSGPDVAVALIHVDSCIGGATVARHVLPSLLALLISGGARLPAKQQPLRSAGRTPEATVMMGIVTVLEGLLPSLPEAVILRQLVGPAELPDGGGTRPTELLQLLLAPDVHRHASSQLRNRVAALLLQACKVAGGQQAFQDGLLPQLLPIFHCREDLRGAYGAAYSTSERSGSTSSGFSTGNVPDAEAAEHSDSGYWDLVYILYPEVVDTAGLVEARDAVPDWATLEHTLQARYGWRPSPATLHAAEAAAASSLRQQASVAERRRRQEQLFNSESGWSEPAATGRPSPQRGADAAAKHAARPLSTSRPTSAGPADQPDVGNGIGRLSSNGNRQQQPWHWLPTVATVPAVQPRSPSGNELAQNGMFWQQPWRLRTDVVHQWRAFPERLRALAVSEDEATVVTAGRGTLAGAEAEVVRCWSLANGSGGAQYSQHAAAVTAVCLLPAHTQLAATRDAAGAAHLWSTASGSQAACFPGPGLAPATGSQRQRPRRRGWLPTGGAPLGRPAAQGPMQAGTAPDGGVAAQDQPSGSRSLQGYTCMAALERSGRLSLAVGTASGQVDFLDVATAALTASMLAMPDEGSAAVSALHPDSSLGSALLAVGLDSGAATLLDARCGDLLAAWHAHGERVTSLASDGHCLVTTSLDRSMKLWDLRACSGSAHQLSPPTATQPGLLHRFGGFKHAVTAVTAHRGTAISCSRGKVALTPLAPPYAAEVHLMRLTSSVRGISSRAPIAGLAMLPASRLMVVGCEDGIVKVCA